MSDGSTCSPGSRLSRDASIAGRTVSKNDRISVFMAPLERHGAGLPGVVLKENLHLAFRLIQGAVAETRQAYTLLEKLECRVERKLATFEFPDDFFQTL